MEIMLFDAALVGDNAALSQLLEKDPMLLHKNYTNCEDKNALHIGAMLGHQGFVQAILQIDPTASNEMCFARDRAGRNPLHLAAIHGRVNILKLAKDSEVLFQAAMEKADQGGTILHLCVKHNQLEALKLLLDIFTNPESSGSKTEDGIRYLDEFLGAKNDDGMTILHLAIYYNQQKRRKQMVIYLLDNLPAIVNLKNTEGDTALDILAEKAGVNQRELVMKSATSTLLLRDLLQRSQFEPDIADSLIKAKALPGRNVTSSKDMQSWQEFVEKRSETIMIVASLIATMAFQAVISPPGGVWQDDSPAGSPNPHRAGESVMAQTHPHRYKRLTQVNTAAFVTSLITITLLVLPISYVSRLRSWLFFVILLMGTWLTVVAMSISYGTSLDQITPMSGRNRDLISAYSFMGIFTVFIWGAYSAYSALKAIWGACSANSALKAFGICAQQPNNSSPTNV